MYRGSNSAKSVPYFLTALTFLASASMPTLAQQQDAPTSYEVTETSVANPAVAKENAGPVRMARFSLVKGRVNTRPTPKVDWAPAYINQPIRQGEQVYVPNGSRVEIQFDDGSVVRLAGGAFITMQTLYSDEQGEFTEIKLNDGLSNWRLKNKLSVYQIDTPNCSVKAAGPAKFRVGSRNECEVAANTGNCTVENRQGHTDLTPGKYVKVSSIDEPMKMLPEPPADNWQQWNDERDHVYDAGDTTSQRNLPPDIALTAPDLDTYGSWNNEPTYGNVWYPRVSEAGWRPYHHGHWVWADPFGWTWVGEESWGWAPYHYGTWIHSHRGWGWCPGPAHQYWSPANVSFSSYNGDVAWAPLCPEEVRYPSRLAIGFSGGDWALSFSIGGCGAYYPGPRGVCYGRAWNNVYINRATYVTNYHGYGGRPLYASNYNSYMRPGAWTPRNARFGGGSMIASNRFGVSNRYNFVARNNINVFQRGRAVGIPGNGRAPSLGPSHVRPTLASLTPAHAFNRGGGPSAALASRPLFRSALNQRVAGGAPNFGSRLAANSPVRANAAGRPVFGATNRPGVAGRPGFGAGNRPGATALNNRPGVPGAAGVRGANRPGSLGKPNSVVKSGVQVPGSVQAARKALGGQNGRNVAKTGRPNTTGRTPAANVRTAQANHGVKSGPANQHAANANRRNPAQTRTAHTAATAHRANASQHTAINRAHTNQFAHRAQPAHTNNQSARIAQPSQTRRNNGSFQRGSFSSNAGQSRVTHSAPRTFDAPQNRAPQPNFGGGGRSSFGGGARPNFNGGGGRSNAGGGGRPNFGGGGGQMSRPQPSAPRGGSPSGGGGNRGGGGGGRPGGGGHDRRG